MSFLATLLLIKILFKITILLYFLYSRYLKNKGFEDLDKDSYAFSPFNPEDYYSFDFDRVKEEEKKLSNQSQVTINKTSVEDAHNDIISNTDSSVVKQNSNKFVENTSDTKSSMVSLLNKDTNN